jgi:hypothetical protein
VAVLECAGLLLSQDHYLPGTLGEPLEQGPRIPPPGRAGKLRLWTAPPRGSVC